MAGAFTASLGGETCCPRAAEGGRAAAEAGAVSNSRVVAGPTAEPGGRKTGAVAESGVRPAAGAASETGARVVLGRVVVAAGAGRHPEGGSVGLGSEIGFGVSPRWDRESPDAGVPARWARGEGVAAPLPGRRVAPRAASPHAVLPAVSGAAAADDGRCYQPCVPVPDGRLADRGLLRLGVTATSAVFFQLRSKRCPLCRFRKKRRIQGKALDRVGSFSRAAETS